MQDALLGYLAALPLMFLGLVLLPGKNQNTGTGVDAVHCAVQASPGRLLVSTAVAVALLGAGVAGLTLIGNGVHRVIPGLSPHAAIVTTVAMGSSVEADNVRIIVQSAQWVRQPEVWGKEPLGAAVEQTDAPDDRDRVYLEVTIENVGATLHSVGRGEFRILAQDGRVWAPLADDFPPILLSPGGKLTTRFIFEVPAGTAHLQFVSPVDQLKRQSLSPTMISEVLLARSAGPYRNGKGNKHRSTSKNWIYWETTA